MDENTELRELLRVRSTRWDRFGDWLEDWSPVIGLVAVAMAVVGLVLAYA